MTEYQDNDRKYIDPSLIKGEADHNQELEPWIKRYTKSELAGLYRWHTDTLRRHMLEKPELMQKLHENGYSRWQREFTHQQVRLIFEYIGEPDFP